MTGEANVAFEHLPSMCDGQHTSVETFVLRVASGAVCGTNLQGILCRSCDSCHASRLVHS